MEHAERLLAAGEFEQAAAICRGLLKRSPEDRAILSVLIRAQAALGDFAGARATIEKALKGRPADPELLADTARTWLHQGRFPEAIRAVERVLRIAPNNTSYIGLKAHILGLSGDAQAAWETMRPMVEAGMSNSGLATSLGQIAARVGQTGRAITMIRGCLSDPALSPVLRTELSFRLGDLLDSQGDWDAAFAAYAEGNRLRRAAFRFDVGTTIGETDELIARWSPGHDLPVSSIKSDRPIFIVGMPRSGTSLVEQILGSHPGVFPAGELLDIQNLAQAWQGPPRVDVPIFRRIEQLTAARLDSAARAYLQRLRRLDGGAARVTDKMPVNFLHLGLISLMFPEARIVHCTRDPVDTCLSCYFQNFSGSIPFAYDLRELGQFYLAYRRLMAHWQQVLRVPMRDVPYEGLVRDQEAMSRNLVNFAGLAWDDRCLRFHESKRIVLTSSNAQVRKPMYSSSIGRWKAYEKHLGPLLEALAG